MFGFENTINAMRDNYKSINSSIEYLQGEHKDHLRRLDKIEADILQMGQTNQYLTQQVSYVKENYVFKKVYEEQKAQMKNEYTKMFNNLEEGNKKLIMKQAELERDMAEGNERLK